MFSALQSTSGTLNRWRKQGPNRCIIGDAILPQSSKKIDQKCGSEFITLLYHHLTMQGKLQYRCTTTVPQVHNSPKDILKNLLPV